MTECDPIPDGGRWRCRICGWTFGESFRRNCPGPANPLPQPELSRRLSICRTCPELNATPVYCRRDLRPNAQGQPCEAGAVRAWPGHFVEPATCPKHG